jgi:hypothetical protein
MLEVALFIVLSSYWGGNLLSLAGMALLFALLRLLLGNLAMHPRDHVADILGPRFAAQLVNRYLEQHVWRALPAGARTASDCFDEPSLVTRTLDLARLSRAGSQRWPRRGPAGG